MNFRAPDGVWIEEGTPADVADQQPNQSPASSTPGGPADRAGIRLALASEEERFGHTWIMIEMPDRTVDSYGFWPQNVQDVGMRMILTDAPTQGISLEA